MGATPADTSAVLEVLRRGEEIKLDVVLGELPDDTSKLAFQDRMKKKSDNALGLVVETINDDIRKELAIPGGVVVSEVEHLYH